MEVCLRRIFLDLVGFGLWWFCLDLVDVCGHLQALFGIFFSGAVICYANRDHRRLLVYIDDLSVVASTNSRV